MAEMTSVPGAAPLFGVPPPGAHPRRAFIPTDNSLHPSSFAPAPGQQYYDAAHPLPQHQAGDGSHAAGNGFVQRDSWQQPLHSPDADGHARGDYFSVPNAMPEPFYPQQQQQQQHFPPPPQQQHLAVDTAFLGPPSSSMHQGGRTPGSVTPGTDDGSDIALLQSHTGSDGGFSSTVQLPGGTIDLGRYQGAPSGAQTRRMPQRVRLARNGHLVLDRQIPTQLKSALKPERQQDTELTQMRYTAVTCDADHFQQEGFTLRQAQRDTELFIVVTIYEETADLLLRTIYGIQRCIKHICTKQKAPWLNAAGEAGEAWRKIVVCIVADGREKIQPRVLDALAALGVYQPDIAHESLDGQLVHAHVFEYTSQVTVNKGLKLHPDGIEGSVPVQFLFCLKEKNARKINSHRWFFNAFSQTLDPSICILLDCGTEPKEKSLYRLWRAFENNPNIGGACGEIMVQKGENYGKLWNPLVAIQNFEYKMSNILDKPLESIFGYITVLPGAFSAYRWEALQNQVIDGKVVGPLAAYFRGEKLETEEGASLWTKNAYLAEDRILCWELVAKNGGKWLLHYQRGATASTDVQTDLPGLVLQRRRWLNGSFFASASALCHFYYLYQSKHSFMRKLCLHFELLYQFFSMLFAWFALSSWYLTFVILLNSFRNLVVDGAPWISTVNVAVKYTYIALMVACFTMALGNKPKGSNFLYSVIACVFAAITVYMLGAVGYITYRGAASAIASVENEGLADAVLAIFRNYTFVTISVSLLSTFILYIVASLLAGSPYHLITSFLQYLLFAPSFTNVVNVYAFANINDVSWGTREEVKAPKLAAAQSQGDEAVVSMPATRQEVDAAYDNSMRKLQEPEEKEKKKSLDPADAARTLRTYVVLTWAFMNAGVIAGILNTEAGNTLTPARTNFYMAVLLYSVAALSAIRFLGSTAYTINWLRKYRSRKKRNCLCC
ncbi:hypothetical protein JCM6882_008248 [Rhodosporidiobolus microsporus]